MFPTDRGPEAAIRHQCPHRRKGLKSLKVLAVCAMALLTSVHSVIAAFIGECRVLQRRWGSVMFIMYRVNLVVRGCYFADVEKFGKGDVAAAPRGVWTVICPVRFDLCHLSAAEDQMESCSIAAVVVSGARHPRYMRWISRSHRCANSRSISSDLCAKAMTTASGAMKRI